VPLCSASSFGSDHHDVEGTAEQSVVVQLNSFIPASVCRD
jgi:hypothetical protein